MLVPMRVIQTGAVLFALSFSTIATAQYFLFEAPQAPAAAPAPLPAGIRELPVNFPQGRLYCAKGSLAYMKLYPQEWETISAADAVRVASRSVDETCAGDDKATCREYRARLSKLRLAIRSCF